MFVQIIMEVLSFNATKKITALSLSFNCFPSRRHMIEIQALHSRQKEEIDALFTRMGKTPPSTVFSPAVAMAGGRRRIKSKSHKSPRSSGQPSPLHSGKDREVALLKYFGCSKKTNSIIRFDICHIFANQTAMILRVCSLLLNAKLNSVLGSYVQDPQPQPRASMVQCPLQRKVHPQRQKL